MVPSTSPLANGAIMIALLALLLGLAATGR
jgi:hypothetical protein